MSKLLFSKQTWTITSILNGQMECENTTTRTRQSQQSIASNLIRPCMEQWFKKLVKSLKNFGFGAEQS
jgi:hypothetical protein